MFRRTSGGSWRADGCIARRNHRSTLRASRPREEEVIIPHVTLEQRYPHHAALRTRRPRVSNVHGTGKAEQLDYLARSGLTMLSRPQIVPPRSGTLLSLSVHGCRIPVLIWCTGGVRGGLTRDLIPSCRECLDRWGMPSTGQKRPGNALILQPPPSLSSPKDAETSTHYRTKSRLRVLQTPILNCNPLQPLLWSVPVIQRPE